MNDHTANLPDVPPNSRGAGRPPAKHSSPDYVQMTVYVPKVLRNAVKMRLFRDGLEMSATVERLLRTWMATWPAEKEIES